MGLCGPCHTGGLCHNDEEAVAVIVKEPVAYAAGEIVVEVAVIVIVCAGHLGDTGAIIQLHCLGDLTKGASLIAKEAKSMAHTGARSRLPSLP